MSATATATATSAGSAGAAAAGPVELVKWQQVLATWREVAERDLGTGQHAVTFTNVYGQPYPKNTPVTDTIECSGFTWVPGGLTALMPPSRYTITKTHRLEITVSGDQPVRGFSFGVVHDNSAKPKVAVTVTLRERPNSPITKHLDASGFVGFVSPYYNVDKVVIENGGQRVEIDQWGYWVDTKHQKPPAALDADSKTAVALPLPLLPLVETREPTALRMERKAESLPPVDRVVRCFGAVALVQQPTSRATGFMISPHLFMTNHHVLPDAQTAAAAFACFGLDAAGDYMKADLKAHKPQWAFAPDTLFVSSKELDMTVVAIKPKAAAADTKEAAYPTSFIPLEVQRVMQGDVVHVIGHPKSLSKRLSSGVAKKDPADSQILHYETEIDHGSSGGPALNHDFQFLALHSGQALDPNSTANAEAVARMKLQGVMVMPKNYGISGTKIINFLNETAAALPDAQSKLLKSALPEPPAAAK